MCGGGWLWVEGLKIERNREASRSEMELSKDASAGESGVRERERECVKNRENEGCRIEMLGRPFY